MKAKFSEENADNDDVSKKYQVPSQSVAVFYPEKSMVGIISPQPRQWLLDHNTLVGIVLIELTEPSHTLNYKLFFKHCILQTILHVILLFIFVWNKILCSEKLSRILHFFFLIWFGVAFDVTVLKVPCLWSSLYKVIGNESFFS